METITPAGFMKEVLKTVEVIGIEKTVMVLQSGRAEHTSRFTDPVIQFVISEVCKQYNLPIDDLIESRYSKNPDRYYAIGFCCSILANEFELSINVVGKLFGLHRSTVSKRIGAIDTINGKSRNEEIQRHYQIKNKLSTSIREYKISKSLS